jgi:hypothetical protein
MFRPVPSRVRVHLGAGLLLLLLATLLGLQPPPASAGPGYQLTSPPSVSLSGEIPVGVAVDQSSQNVYVAEVSRNLKNFQPGQVEQLSSAGTPTASSPFGKGGLDLFTAVAVNPATGGVFAYQAPISTPLGTLGESALSSFSSAGILGTSFFPESSTAETLAADSLGHVFLPSNTAHGVQVFSASGTLEDTLVCSGCPGGAFIAPSAAAFDSAGKLYVVDRAGTGRLIRLTPSGGSYVYEATLLTGGGIRAVAIDTSNDDHFVGKLVNGEYHVVAYDSSGTAFDDFGAELVTAPQFLPGLTGQLAVNATTHRVYLSNPGGTNLWAFERIGSIPAPAATTTAPSPVGQTTATLRANVDPKGHALTNCAFEYTDHADFLANGYTNAEAVPCPPILGSRESIPIAFDLSGLDTDKSYDYRIKVVSYGGSVEGSTQPFHTLPLQPPDATTGSASSIARTAAALGGTVDPRGDTLTSCRFEYVTEAAFQSSGFNGASSKACSAFPSGSEPSPVTANVSGLVPATAYRFRVIAANKTGTDTAIDKSFSTAGESCATNTALCPRPEQALAPFSPQTTVTPTSHAKPLKCRKSFKKKRVRGKLKCVRIKKPRQRR